LDSLIDLLDKFKHISKIVDSKIKELTQQIMQELSDKGEMEHVSQTGVKANIQSQARSYYMLDNIKVNLPEWYKYAVVDVKSVLENGTPEDIEIVNRYKATKRTSPFINTKQTKF
jgi:hypothetical protein